MQRTEAPRDDVPLAVTVGAVSLLVALFLPLAHRPPAWPTELPHLAYDASAVLDDHRRELLAPLPDNASQVARAWHEWARLADAGDASRRHEARARFVETLGDITHGSRDAITALRARATEDFLRGLADPDAPLTRIARRHGLAGPRRRWYAVPAAQIAWFAMSWERVIAAPNDDGSERPLTDMMLMVPRSYQKAFTSWALDARCYELTGSSGDISRAAVRRCASLRVELIPVAAGARPGYPREEALARADVMLARGLRRTIEGSVEAAVTVVHDVDQTVAMAEAQAALVRAQERYARLLDGPHSTLLERNFKAVVLDLSGDE